MPLPLIHYLYPSRLSKYIRQTPSNQSTWALVTGATDGIGLSLAHELAAHGSNVILHGRSASKLERCHSDLSAAYPTLSFRTIAVDASAFTPADIASLVAATSDITLTILINNVGGTTLLSSNFKHFEDTTPQELDALFTLNALFPITLTNALLPSLQRQQSPTLVLTCGSQAAIGWAYTAAYSGAKAALSGWSRALAAEQHEARSQVEVLEVVIGGTYTAPVAKDPNLKPGLFMPSAEVMAKAILKRVGWGHGAVTAYFWHGVQFGAIYGLPRAWADGVVAGILKGSVEAKKAR